MTKIDESQETIARIHMTVDNKIQAQKEEADALTELRLDPATSDEHWHFGSRTKPTTATLIE